MHVRVTVQRLSGNHLQLQLGRRSTVRELKQTIAGHWQIPALCQKLIIGTSCLHDHDCLAEFVPLAVSLDGSKSEYGQISLTLMTSTVELDQCLTSPIPEDRIAAIKAIRQQGRKITQEQCSLLYAIIEKDPDTSVRKEAVDALPCVVSKGDDDAIGALIQSIVDDAEETVKQASAFALPQIVNKDNPAMFASMRVLLESPNAVVKRMGLFALPRVVKKGHASAIEKLTAMLKDPSEMIRFQAIVALSQVANSGDESIVSLVCGQLRDSSGFVRSQVIAALPQMLRRTDHHALAVLKAKMQGEPALAIVLANIAE